MTNNLPLWQHDLRMAVTTFAQLRQEGFRVPTDLTAQQLQAQFRTLIPRYYLGLMDPNDPQDPVARMAIPSKDELVSAEADLRDPIGDQKYLVAPRLTHRYHDRALLHVNNQCTMYCRFCFRKNLMNEREPDLYLGDYEAALTYLASHPEIEEVILSGGDPLVFSDSRLRLLLEAIARFQPSLRRLRIHTRAPVTLPSRVTDGLISTLSTERYPWQSFIVTHFNHPRELTKEALRAVKQLRAAGHILLNQSVLLKGVNDEANVLRELFVGLGNWGVLPYYLHQCDRVKGANHFRVSIARGRALWSQLRGQLPGYLLPEYVLEIPGGGAKVPLGESALRQEEARHYVITYKDQSISYHEDSLE